MSGHSNHAQTAKVVQNCVATLAVYSAVALALAGHARQCTCPCTKTKNMKPSLGYRAYRGSQQPRCPWHSARCTFVTHKHTRGRLSTQTEYIGGGHSTHADAAPRHRPTQRQKMRSVSQSVGPSASVTPSLLSHFSSSRKCACMEGCES